MFHSLYVCNCTSREVRPYSKTQTKKGKGGTAPDSLYLFAHEPMFHATTCNNPSLEARARWRVLFIFKNDDALLLASDIT
jgi:hypothetical protein